MSDAPGPCPRRRGRGGAILIFIAAMVGFALIARSRGCFGPTGEGGGGGASEGVGDVGSVADRGSDAAALPARRTLHLESVSPDVARLLLDGRDLGQATRDPTDGAIRGEAILQVSINASSLSFSDVEITRDPAVPVEIAHGIQNVLATGGALRTRVIDPGAPPAPPR